MLTSGSQDRRFEAIGAAAASVLRVTEYHRVRTQDVAALVRLGEDTSRRASGRRSAVWLYNEVRSRRVLVALGVRWAWDQYLGSHEPPPTPVSTASLTEAIETVAAALLEVARFHRIDSHLVEQAVRGLGDIATSEKRKAAADPPDWPDTAWGRVAAEGYAGRCAAFADYLSPVLARAARCVVPLPAAEVRLHATKLSDLAFHGLSGDGDGPIERIAEGFAAYWFERDLVQAAGGWVRQLRAAELGTLAVMRRRSDDPRSHSIARGTLVRGLLAADTLHARAVTEAADSSHLLADLLQWPSDPVEPVPRAQFETADLRLLCDATSRHGLALHRYGQLDGAVVSYRLSRAVAQLGVARNDPAEAASFAARADHNLAEVEAERGDRTAALARCEAAYRFREKALTDEPELGSAWRHHALTADLRARIVAGAGAPVQAVILAEQLLSAWEARAPGRDNSGVAHARALLGELLLEAGHPLEARHHIEAAYRYARSAGAAPFGLSLLRDRLRLARVALELEEFDAADAVLPAEDELVWCDEHVSFRYCAHARLVRATALARSDHPDEAARLLDRIAVELRERLGMTVSESGPMPGAGAVPSSNPASPSDPVPVSDPTLRDLARVRAEVLWRQGHLIRARTLFTQVVAEHAGVSGGRFDPEQAEALRWLARCADALDEPERADETYTALRESARATLEPGHRVLLAADVDHAHRLLARARFDDAVRLLTAVIDRNPLGHSRPALENGHPLLAAARDLARQLGLSTVVGEPSWRED